MWYGCTDTRDIIVVKTQERIVVRTEEMIVVGRPGRKVTDTASMLKTR